MYKNFLKPLLDLVISGIILILFLPIFIIITLLLYVTNNGEPFFFQKRPGKNEKLFVIIKFKTMNDKRNLQDVLLTDSERLTKIGAFIRRTSLDEIPQLINVIKGDMSLVGPRPLLPEYLSLYNNIQKQRHQVKPGITGWAQVNGRNAIGWSQKFEHDIFYIKNSSFILDIKIIFKTIKKVFYSEGITNGENVMMDRFKGNK